MKVSIVGITGYSGLELVKILNNHKKVELVSIHATKEVGRRLSDVYPYLAGVCDLKIEDFNAQEIIEKAEFDYGIWDNVVSELQALYPSYASISLTAGKAQISKPGNMRSSDTAAFDTQTGEITTVTAYSDVPRAQKMKGWFYAFHTGSWGGMTTKVLYFLAAFIGGILPLSGYYLWLKKKRLSKKKVFRTIFETKCI